MFSPGHFQHGSNIWSPEKQGYVRFWHREHFQTASKDEGHGVEEDLVPPGCENFTSQKIGPGHIQSSSNQPGDNNHVSTTRSARRNFSGNSRNPDYTSDLCHGLLSNNYAKSPFSSSDKHDFNTACSATNQSLCVPKYVSMNENIHTDKSIKESVHGVMSPDPKNSMDLSINGPNVTGTISPLISSGLCMAPDTLYWNSNGDIPRDSLQGAMNYHHHDKSPGYHTADCSPQSITLAVPSDGQLFTNTGRKVPRRRLSSVDSSTSDNSSSSDSSSSCSSSSSASSSGSSMSSSSSGSTSSTNSTTSSSESSVDLSASRCQSSAASPHSSDNSHCNTIKKPHNDEIIKESPQSPDDDQHLDCVDMPKVPKILIHDMEIENIAAMEDIQCANQFTAAIPKLELKVPEGRMMRKSVSYPSPKKALPVVQYADSPGLPFDVSMSSPSMPILENETLSLSSKRDYDEIPEITSELLHQENGPPPSRNDLHSFKPIMGLACSNVYVDEKEVTMNDTESTGTDENLENDVNLYDQDSLDMLTKENIIQPQSEPIHTNNKPTVLPYSTNSIHTGTDTQEKRPLIRIAIGNHKLIKRNALASMIDEDIETTPDVQAPNLASEMPAELKYRTARQQDSENKAPPSEGHMNEMQHAVILNTNSGKYNDVSQQLKPDGFKTTNECSVAPKIRTRSRSRIRERSMERNFARRDRNRSRSNSRSRDGRRNNERRRRRSRSNCRRAHDRNDDGNQGRNRSRSKERPRDSYRSRNSSINKQGCIIRESSRDRSKIAWYEDDRSGNRKSGRDRSVGMPIKDKSNVRSLSKDKSQTNSPSNGRSQRSQSRDRFNRNSHSNDRDKRSLSKDRSSRSRGKERNGRKSLSKDRNRRKSSSKDSRKRRSPSKDRMKKRSHSKDRYGRRSLSKDSRTRRSHSKERVKKRSLSKERSKSTSHNMDRSKRRSLGRDISQITGSRDRNESSSLSRHRNERSQSKDRNKKIDPYTGRHHDGMLLDRGDGIGKVQNVGIRNSGKYAEKYDGYLPKGNSQVATVIDIYSTRNEDRVIVPAHPSVGEMENTLTCNKFELATIKNTVNRNPFEVLKLQGSINDNPDGNQSKCRGNIALGESTDNRTIPINQIDQDKSHAYNNTPLVVSPVQSSNLHVAGAWIHRNRNQMDCLDKGTDVKYDMDRNKDREHCSLNRYHDEGHFKGVDDGHNNNSAVLLGKSKPSYKQYDIKKTSWEEHVGRTHNRSTMLNSPDIEELKVQALRSKSQKEPSINMHPDHVNSQMYHSPPEDGQNNCNKVPFVNPDDLLRQDSYEEYCQAIEAWNQQQAVDFSIASKIKTKKHTTMVRTECIPTVLDLRKAEKEQESKIALLYDDYILQGKVKVPRRHCSRSRSPTRRRRRGRSTSRSRTRTCRSRSPHSRSRKSRTRSRSRSQYPNRRSKEKQNETIEYLTRHEFERLPAGYCFVEFPDPQTAHKAMLRLNGKIIPGSVPPKRYKLNLASFGREHLLIPEHSLFVGDLTEDVDDYMLYTVFATKYKSCRAAKIVLDEHGVTRGYGFCRFTDEGEQQRALHEMNGYKGLGKRAIRVSLATPKRPSHNPYPNYNPYYMQHQQYYNNWWQAYQQPSQYYGADYGADYGTDQTQEDASTVPGTEETGQYQLEDDEALEDPELEIDVDKLNREFMNASEELYTALEGSRWHPLDTVTSTISNTAKVK